MTRFDRGLIVSLSIAVVALAFSGAAPWRRGPAPVVRAADCGGNAPLDVVRRGLQFAHATATAERDRAGKLAGSRLSLAALRAEIDHAFSLFKSENERYRELVKSSVQGDKQLAQDTLKRSNTWLKVERTLSEVYLRELKHQMTLAVEDYERVRGARRRSDLWRALEVELDEMFLEELKRLKAAPRAHR